MLISNRASSLSPLPSGEPFARAIDLAILLMHWGVVNFRSKCAFLDLSFPLWILCDPWKNGLKQGKVTQCKTYQKKEKEEGKVSEGRSVAWLIERIDVDPNLRSCMAFLLRRENTSCSF